MSKILSYPSPSIKDNLFNPDTITYNNQGIDTIQLIAKYSTIKSMVERMGLIMVAPSKNTPITKQIEKLEEIKDHKKRLKQDQFKPTMEVVKLSKGKSLSNYMMITRNIPLLFDHAEHHKKAKDTYCLITFAGLHQPTKQIKSEAMKHISKILKRKAFKLYSLDIAIDTTDQRSITHNRKGAFKDNLMPYAKHGVISKGSSLYINNTDHHSINKIIYYDKYLKQTKTQKQGGLSNDLRAWKRLEITLTFDVTKRENRGFIDYIESLNFINDLYDIDQVAGLAGIRNYENDYLTYQLNSLIDNRFMNNHESKEQFNSLDALERFKQSEFRRYLLPI